MGAPREIELKLEAEAQAMPALAAHPLLQAGGDGGTQVQTSTYFDTAAGDLRKAGLTLRVRRQGERRLQTVKTGAAGIGLFDRAEWEVAIAGDVPDAAALADTPAAAILADARSPGLAPVFATVVERTTRPIAYGGSRISATLDQGRVETGAGDVPLCEVELELVAGAPADLFALARALAETVPLRLGAMSKSERGFALVGGTLRRPSKAGAVVVDEDATAGAAFATIARACLRHLRLNEEVFLHGHDPEALHQMRVALRRLRSAFTLFKPILAPDPAAAHLRAEIKRISEPFGQARNLDVFLSETLPAEVARRPDEAGLATLGDRLEAARRSAYEAVTDTLAAPAWRNLVLDLVAWIETGPWRGEGGPPERDAPARDFAAAMLERLRRRIKARGRHLERLDPEARHRVRIEAKKLRYGAEFFAALYGRRKALKRHKAFVAALAALQGHLGTLNDRATAHAIAAGAATAAEGEAEAGPAAFAAGLTAADGERDTQGLLDAAAEAHADLVDLKPFWRRDSARRG